jgi:hypothetical protein
MLVLSRPVVPIHPLPPALWTQNPAAQNAKPWKEINNTLEGAVKSNTLEGAVELMNVVLCGPEKGTTFSLC